jgi:hypothetical protein
MDVAWGRFAPGDFVPLQNMAKRLAVRVNGMDVYWDFVDPKKVGFLMTSAPGSSSSTPATPVASRDSPSSHQVLLHSSLLHLAVSRSPRSVLHAHDEPVGVFESQKYLHLEAAHVVSGSAEDERYAAEATALLKACCGDLVLRSKEGVDGVVEWLETVREGRWSLRQDGIPRICDRRGKKIQDLKVQLEASLEMFRNEKRQVVILLLFQFATSKTALMGLTLQGVTFWIHFVPLSTRRMWTTMAKAMFHLIVFCSIATYINST